MRRISESVMNEMRELAGLPYEVVDESVQLEEEGSDSTIKALRDTDYRDKDAFFKMVQLLKGLAAASEKDDLAKRFMSMVSDALTDVAEKVVDKADGEGS